MTAAPPIDMEAERKAFEALFSKNPEALQVYSTLGQERYWFHKGWQARGAMQAPAKYDTERAKNVIQKIKELAQEEGENSIAGTFARRRCIEIIEKEFGIEP